MSSIAILKSNIVPLNYSRLLSPTRHRRIFEPFSRPKTPSYLKATIRKNGQVIKRPTVRPKHLVDCLRDPVHYEFFKRFAKEMGFESATRFWKSVESMKEIDDPQAQLRSVSSPLIG